MRSLLAGAHVVLRTAQGRAPRAVGAYVMQSSSLLANMERPLFTSFCEALQLDRSRVCGCGVLQDFRGHRSPAARCPHYKL